jgi:hypothetical protein
MAHSGGIDHWPVEEIPDPDRLFYRVHVNSLAQGQLVPGALREQRNPEAPQERGSMSTEWEKYASPEEALSRSSDSKKNGIVSLVVGEVRKIPGLVARHDPNTPRPPLRSHAGIEGISAPVGAAGESPYAGLAAKKRKTMIREKLLKVCEWVIEPPGDPSSERAGVGDSSPP